MKLQIWDTAGQERYRAITQSFYKGAQGIILVFDLSDNETFLTIKNWLENIKAYADDGVIKILLGNKCDKERAIKESDIKALVKESNMQYFETSAKENINIDEAFTYLAKEIKNFFFKRFTSGSIFGQESKKLYTQEQEKKDDILKKDCC